MPGFGGHWIKLKSGLEAVKPKHCIFELAGNKHWFDVQDLPIAFFNAAAHRRNDDPVYHAYRLA